MAAGTTNFGFTQIDYANDGELSFIAWVNGMQGVSQNNDNKIIDSVLHNLQTQNSAKVFSIVGDGIATSFSFTHNRNTINPTCSLLDVDNDLQLLDQVTPVGTMGVTVTFRKPVPTGRQFSLSVL